MRRTFVSQLHSLEKTIGESQFEAAQRHVTESMEPSMRKLAHTVLLNDGSLEDLSGSVTAALEVQRYEAPTCQ